MDKRNTRVTFADNNSEDDSPLCLRLRARDVREGNKPRGVLFLPPCSRR